MTDESGAVLPGVTVTATQTDTTFSRAVVTDASGNYVMTNLPTGPYRLEMPTGAQFGIGFVNPSDPDYDRGHCEQDRTHLANFTVGYQTPAFDKACCAVLRQTGVFRVSSTRAQDLGCRS